MLGHAKASMTLDTYADLFDDDLDAGRSTSTRQLLLPGTVQGPNRNPGPMGYARNRADQRQILWS